MKLRPILTAIAILLGSAATAQDSGKSTAQIAAELAYTHCPDYLSGDFPLVKNPVLKKLGFGGTIEKANHPRFGELEVVGSKNAEGELIFGGVPESICQVIVTGAKSDEAWAAFHEGMPRLGFDLKLDPGNSGNRNGATVETYKATVDGDFLYVQLAKTTLGSRPGAFVQIFVMDQ